MFSTIEWHNNYLKFNNHLFKLEHFKDEPWFFDDQYFGLYKIKKLVDQYQKYFDANKLPNIPLNVFEIGLWDGGSAVFWNEILKPKRLVGVDIMSNRESNYLKNYLKGSKIRIYWETDQSDSKRLREIIAENFKSEALDLVFDDGSHMYHQTLVSFNTIFPYLKAGGLYIIEDWAWAHWLELENGQPIGTAPTKFILELVQATGNEGLIESVTVFEGFTVVKKGQMEIGNRETFNLKDHVLYKPKDLKTKVKEVLQISGLKK